MTARAPGALSPLAWLALAKGWCRESLAEASGVSAETMRRLWCSSNRPSRLTAQRLAGPLGVAPVDVHDPLRWLSAHGLGASPDASTPAATSSPSAGGSPVARVARAYAAAATGELRWWERAACRDADPELFWPEPGDEAAAALALCAACPVVGDCREAFLAQPRDEGGVWFTNTALDRQAHTARRQGAAA